MNEEEKKAIELLKKDSTDYYYRSIDVRNAVRVALNYIDKLQKENEEYHRIKKELIRVNKKIYDVDTIDEFIKTIDKLQKELEEKTTILMAGADKVKQLEKENKESKELYDKLLIGYNKLVQEHLELEKTIDLIIDDLQDTENYFENMTNKEVREYYKKRKELKE